MIRLDDIFKWLLTPILIFVSGCATIVSKSEYDISVSCNVSGATVNVYKDGALVNTSATPTVITLSSKGGYFWPASYRFEFVKGASRDQVELDAEFDWWYLGNFILPYGILVASIVDPMTGAMWKFDDDASVYGQIDSARGESLIGLPKVLGDVSKTPLVQPLVQTKLSVAVSAEGVVAFHTNQGVVSCQRRVDRREVKSFSELVERKGCPKVSVRLDSKPQMFVIDNISLQK